MLKTLKRTSNNKYQLLMIKSKYSLTQKHKFSWLKSVNKDKSLLSIT